MTFCTVPKQKFKNATFQSAETQWGHFMHNTLHVLHKYMYLSSAVHIHVLLSTKAYQNKTKPKLANV